MTTYFSESTMGFYSTEVFSVSMMPSDVIEITESQHINILSKINNEHKDIKIIDGKVTFMDRIPEPITWDIIKIKRNQLLLDTDYTQISDWPGDKDAWATYRQELRDITQSFKNPEDVVWPSPPGA